MPLDNYEQLNSTSQNPDQSIPPSNVRGDNQSSSQGDYADELPEELINAIEDYIKDFKQAEEEPRQKILKIAKKGELYWEGIQRVFWDADVSDYRTPEDAMRYFPDMNIDPEQYEKIVNIYKAHGESIIAALSAEIPPVIFFPEDADVFEDILTAKSYSNLAKIIQSHNKSPLLFIKALFILFNQGMIAGYNYVKEDKKFGVNRQPIQQIVPQTHRALYCPQCGLELGESQLPPDVAARSNPPDVYCPNCEDEVGPEFEDVPTQTPQISGYSEQPKKREIIELFGPTNVQIPHYATTQDQIDILILKTDQHRGLIIDVFGEKAKNVGKDTDNYKYDRWARGVSDDYGSLPENVGTLEQVWIRPWAFHTMDEGDDDNISSQMFQRFPSGAYCVFFNDEYVFSSSEDMDDHWSISINPTSNKIHSQPLGKPVQPIQDMTNETKNLTLETIRFAVPETFVDPQVVSLRKYKKTEVQPGMLIPAKPKAGKALAESFYTNKTASLSREVEPFAQSLTEDAQFTSGAFPSIYGGALEGGSGTLGEYNSSRAQALQRLQIVWKVVKQFWTDLMSHAVTDFVNNMETDERFVEESGRQSFINVWVRRRNLYGQVGRVEPQATEGFPVSWTQKRDIIIGLIQFNNPDINALIFHPENRSLIARMVGLDELFVPGDGDRDKQLAEIVRLIQDPNPQIIMSPMGGELILPSVDIDAGVDADDVHIATCIAFLLSPAGQELKEFNPGAYMNIIAHKELHEYHANKQMMYEQKQLTSGSGPPVEAPPEENQESKSKPKAVQAA